MKYAYKTNYKSNEHMKVKAEGAKWSADLKLWLSDKPIEGLVAEPPSSKYLVHFSYDDQVKRRVVERVKAAFIEMKKQPELKDKLDEILAKAKEYFQEDTFTNQCCLVAIEENLQKFLGGNCNG